MSVREQLLEAFELFLRVAGEEVAVTVVPFVDRAFGVFPRLVDDHAGVDLVGVLPARPQAHPLPVEGDVVDQPAGVRLDRVEVVRCRSDPVRGALDGVEVARLLGDGRDRCRPEASAGRPCRR
jgi:hypothetical protein